MACACGGRSSGLCAAAASLVTEGLTIARMPTVSGMLNTDAMNFVECPNCHPPAGKLCTDHRGKKLSIQHAERVAEYQSKFKDRAALYKDGKEQVEKVREYNRKLSKSQ